jgi:choline dehydrogenase-like flavoprotein
MTADAPTAVGVTDAERRLKAVLRAVAAILLAMTVAALVVAEIGDGLREPPWVAVAVGAGVLAAQVAIFAAGEPRRRAGLVAVLLLMLAVAALAQVAYAIAGEGDLAALLAVAAVELGLAAAVLLAALAARRSRRGSGPPPPSGHWPSDADAGLRPVLFVLGGLAAVVAIVAAVDPSQTLLSAHVAAGGAGFAGLAIYVALGIEDRLPLAGLLAVALIAGAVATAVFSLRHADLDEPLAIGVEMSALAWLLISIGGAAAIAALLLLLRRAAMRQRLPKQKFLGPTEHRTLMALADVIVNGEEEAVPPAQIAANVDKYFGGIRARRKQFQRYVLVALQLHPLLTLKAPFSELDEESRLDHLKTRFHREVLRGRLPDQVKQFVQAMIRVANQLTYVGYYSDPDSFASIGYEPFEERERYRRLDAAKKVPTPGDHPLEVTSAADLNGDELEADFCIVGSGAAGAVLALRLAEHGSVIVLERGAYVQPKDFNADEVDMIGRLYGDGVFQQTRDFRFTVLQGSCVGGSTVVNNAVSIPPPDEVLERWNRRHGAGLDVDRLRRSTASVEKLLSIHGQDEGPDNPDIRLNPSAPKFLAGVERRRQDPEFQLEVGAVRANIDGCLGCGYCNIGCKYGKKLSMLDTVLPHAQERYGADRVRIVSDCPVTKIVTRDGEVRAVEAKLDGGRKITVRARRFVVAAGTVASSFLLRESGIGKSLPVGRHVSFNMGAPLTAEFDEELDAYDGLQISHIGLPPSDRGWVLETWWNPPVSQALNMPGWFETHYENMRRYRKLMAVGALVGTERNASISKALLGGPDIDYVPTQGDMRKLADGLVELGRILFAGGAKAVMLNGWEYYRFTSAAGLAEIPGILRDPSLVTLGTGHPQGGNAIGRDPAESVVDPGFRVHGYSNLYVCDASVFPSSLTVNPQLTVMSLAEYAAPLIANGAHP